MKGAQNNDGLDGRAGQLGRDIRRNPRQADHLDLQHLPRSQRTLEVGTTEVLQAQHKGAAGDGPLDLVGVNGQLIADRGSDQVGAVRIEPLLHQEIDLPEIDDTEIDRQFLGFADPRP